MQDKQQLWIAGVVVAALVAGVGGFVLGGAGGTDTKTVLTSGDGGFEVLAAKAVTNVQAEMVGTFVKAADGKITIEKDDEQVAVALPVGQETFSLEVISDFTEEDTKQMEKYEEEMRKFNEALQNVDYTNPDQVATDAYPTPPVLGFSYRDDFSAAGGTTSPVRKKVVSTQVPLSDFKEGDNIRISLSNSSIGTPGMTGDTVAAETPRALSVSFVTATRDESTPVTPQDIPQETPETTPAASAPVTVAP